VRSAGTEFSLWRRSYSALLAGVAAQSALVRAQVETVTVTRTKWRDRATDTSYRALTEPAPLIAHIEDLRATGDSLERGCSLLEQKCAGLAEKVDSLTSALTNQPHALPLFAEPRSCRAQTAAGAVGGALITIGVDRLLDALRRR
jgi:hypothetical protein